MENGERLVLNLCQRNFLPTKSRGHNFAEYQDWGSENTMGYWTLSLTSLWEPSEVTVEYLALLCKVWFSREEQPPYKVKSCLI